MCFLTPLLVCLGSLAHLTSSLYLEPLSARSGPELPLSLQAPRRTSTLRRCLRLCRDLVTCTENTAHPSKKLEHPCDMKVFHGAFWQLLERSENSDRVLHMRNLIFGAEENPVRDS